MKNKGIKLGAVLAVMLLISMAFVPAVSAKVDNSDTKEIEPLVRIQIPEVSTEVLKNDIRADYLKKALMSLEVKEITNEFYSRGYKIDFENVEVISVSIIDTNNYGVRVDIPFQTGNESVLAALTTYFNDQGQETFGHIKNGDKYEIFPHNNTNQDETTPFQYNNRQEGIKCLMSASQHISIPGYEYVGTYEIDDICYAIGGSCFALFLATVFNIIPGDEAAVGTFCGSASGACFLADTIIKYTSCDNPTIIIYSRKPWNPIGPEIMVIAYCK